MTAYGGQRDRYIIESFYRMLEGALVDLGWFDLNNPIFEKNPMEIVPGPVNHTDEIHLNTMAVSFEDVTPDPLELGSNGLVLTHEVYVDFFAEDEASGVHVSGDVKAILCGQMPSIGRNWPVFSVLDWSLATPSELFVCSIEQVERNKVHRNEQPWQRYWYTVSAQIEEVRE